MDELLPKKRKVVCENSEEDTPENMTNSIILTVGNGD